MSKPKTFQCLSGTLCAPPEYAFICQHIEHPLIYACVDSWCMRVNYLLGYLTTLLSIYNLTASQYWTSFLKLFFRTRQTLPANQEDRFWHMFSSILLP